MAMVIARRASRVAAAEIIKEAQIKPARTTDTSEFEAVAKLFTDAARKVRSVMKSLGSDKYETFHGGFEECIVLLQDPLYKGSIDARDAYQELLGADQFLRHEADKLGQEYVSPAHFYIAWRLYPDPE